MKKRVRRQLQFWIIAAFIISMSFVYIDTIAKPVIKLSTNTSVSDSLDISFESSLMMKKLFYSRPQRMAIVGKDMNAAGAWGKVNEVYDSLKTGKWYIEEQRYAGETIVAGIVQSNEDAIDRGLFALEWGAKQQQPDGSFNCPDNFHSSSFYVEAVAHSCLLLKASKYYPKYEARIEALKTCILNTVKWMLQPEVLANGLKHNMPYTHRRYLVAAAFGETGVLCKNSEFIRQSASLIKDGLSRQDSSGFNPEKNGYDCSYHSVGLVFAHRYFDIVASKEQREAMVPMFEKGIKWLLTRIDENGNINAEGNTRTGLGQEKGRNGQLKTISFGSVANALLCWAHYTKDKELEAFAEKVHEAAKANKTLKTPSTLK